VTVVALGITISSRVVSVGNVRVGSVGSAISVSTVGATGTSPKSSAAGTGGRTIVGSIAVNSGTSVVDGVLILGIEGAAGTAGILTLILGIEGALGRSITEVIDGKLKDEDILGKLILSAASDKFCNAVMPSSYAEDERLIASLTVDPTKLKVLLMSIESEPMSAMIKPSF